VRAYPGGGFINAGSSSPYAAGLTAWPLPPDVQHVIVQGGFNDASQRPADVGIAAATTLALVRQQAPLASITVVGPVDPGGTFSKRFPNLRANAVAIEQAARAAGARYVDGFGLAFEVGPDKSHPTPTGHGQIGSAVARAIGATVVPPVGAAGRALVSQRPSVIGVSRVGPFGARWFHLAQTRTGGIGPVTSVAFGEAGDLPTLLPDESGGCVPAVYRPSTGVLHVASALVDGGGAVTAIGFGTKGDQLVQNAPYGTPGGRAAFLRRPSTSTFHERVVDAAGTVVTAGLVLGERDDRGLVFNDARFGTTLGVYRPRSSTFLLAAPGTAPGVGVTSVAFGAPGDQGVVGAWGGLSADGSDHVGVFRARESRWILAGTPTPPTGGQAAPITSVTSFHFGDPGDTALACDPV